jgi:hypothetical protein
MQRCKPTKLFEVEQPGAYHEHWLADSHLDAARRAVSHAGEIGVTLDRLDVSSMSPPEDRSKGGIVYVANDTRTYVVVHGRVRRVDPSDKQGVRSKGGRS